MPEKLIVVRDGNTAYVGYVIFDNSVGLATRKDSNTPLVLYRARRLITAHIPVAPGHMIQQVNVYPIDEELGTVDVWVVPTSYYFPTTEGTKRLVKLIERCEHNECALRAKEAGLVTPGQG